MFSFINYVRAQGRFSRVHGPPRKFSYLKLSVPFLQSHGRKSGFQKAEISLGPRVYVGPRKAVLTGEENMGQNTFPSQADLKELVPEEFSTSWSPLSSV